MELPGSIKADFQCTLISQALTPSPAECEFYYTDIVGNILHEFCGDLNLSTHKGVKGGSWSKKNPPRCYLCTKFKRKSLLSDEKIPDTNFTLAK